MFSLSTNCLVFILCCLMLTLAKKQKNEAIDRMVGTYGFVGDGWM
jgi:hypothetical protein